jgi:hypothetical protein
MVALIQVAFVRRAHPVLSRRTKQRRLDTVIVIHTLALVADHGILGRARVLLALDTLAVAC